MGLREKNTRVPFQRGTENRAESGGFTGILLILRCADGLETVVRNRKRILVSPTSYLHNAAAFCFFPPRTAVTPVEVRRYGKATSGKLTRRENGIRNADT